MDIAVQVTVGLFMIGVIFGAGRLSARVDALEAWREELKAEMRGLRAGLDRIEHLITGEER